MNIRPSVNPFVPSLHRPSSVHQSVLRPVADFPFVLPSVCPLIHSSWKVTGNERLDLERVEASILAHVLVDKVSLPTNFQSNRQIQCQINFRITLTSQMYLEASFLKLICKATSGLRTSTCSQSLMSLTLPEFHFSQFLGTVLRQIFWPIYFVISLHRN